MLLFISADLEGISGVTRPEDTATTTPPRPRVAAWSPMTAVKVLVSPVNGVEGRCAAR